MSSIYSCFPRLLGTSHWFKMQQSTCRLVFITIIIRITGMVQNACFDFFYNRSWHQGTCFTTALTWINTSSEIFLGETAIRVSTLQDRRTEARKCCFSIIVPILWNHLEARLMTGSWWQPFKTEHTLEKLSLIDCSLLVYFWTLCNLRLGGLLSSSANHI